MQPPNVARRTAVVERVQHRQHGRHADSGADEHDRLLTVVEDERSAWGSDLQLIADTDVVADVVTGGAVRFNFDADPVVDVSW